ncbi:NAD(P)H-binding protein [Aliiglaciecola litoralis]|uniref:SDR family oxidoreductase n=1 Tax=Aliiglaciecola litoralis TaxID=582857 RepID=A0ABN1LDU7_9ALTE
MKITLIGAGWLGLPLAKALGENGHQILATKRSEKGVLSLQQQHIQAQQFELGQDLSSEAVQALLNTDMLIINIPPGRKTLQPDVFLSQMKALISQAKTSGTKSLLFISTTAVYGEASRVVYEYSEPNPTTDSAKVHVEIEQWIRHTFGPQASILRLAGLVSEDRHPARFLAGKKDIEQGQQVVNLVHRGDVIQAIKYIIKGQHFGQTFHLSARDHPSREAYYCWAAQSLGLATPSFCATTSSELGKQINCQLTLDTLGMTMTYPSPYDMLSNQNPKQ